MNPLESKGGLVGKKENPVEKGRELIRKQTGADRKTKENPIEEFGGAIQKDGKPNRK